MIADLDCEGKLGCHKEGVEMLWASRVGNRRATLDRGNTEEIPGTGGTDTNRASKLIATDPSVPVLPVLREPFFISLMHSYRRA